MSQFHIRAQQPAFKIRFESPSETSAPGQTKPAAASAHAVDGAKSPEQDRLRLSGKTSDPEAPETLDLFDSATPERAQAFMERMSTRHNEVSFGTPTVQLGVGLESQAPELLTSAHEPTLVESIKKRLDQPAQKAAASSSELVRTGASIQTSEAVQLQVGVTSVVSTDLLASKENSPSTKMQHGVYAGLAVKTQTVSSRLAIDNAFGQPRIEVGAAVTSRAETVTLGVSVSQGATAEQKGLRVGAEIKTGTDSVFGVNINKASGESSQTVPQSTSVGIYLNTRFD
jgi:hypothetical protein